jgi:AGCS family alanine or glycine:cation symporter
MYALEKGLGQKWLGILFCVFTVIASFGIGNMVQANSIASMAKETFHLSPMVTGVILCVLTALVILGGVKSIARVCSGLVPFMAIFYVLGCVVILVMNRGFIGPALALIVKSAFTPAAAGGGFAGATVMAAMRYGIARGLFSNESGLGSAPIVAAAARTGNPVRQALVSSTGTFWDTVVICAITGLVIVTSILRNPTGFTSLNGAEITRQAFNMFPGIGPVVLTVGLLTFVYSTILGWSYYGERALEYLAGKSAILPYRLAWVAAVFAGSIVPVPFVWDMADAMNALMAIPNLVALLLLSGVIARETRENIN